MHNNDADHTVRHIIQYYMWIFLPLGILGNCLSMCVFFGTKLRHSSSSIYLGALAIADIGVLIPNFILSFTTTNIRNLFKKQGFCQTYYYLNTVCTSLSVWLVVTFTVERYVAIKWPLRRESLCTVTRAKKTVLVLTVLAIVLSSPMLVFIRSKFNESYEFSEDFCILDEKWKFWTAIYTAVDTVITFIIPMTMIATFNILIARRIKKEDNIRRSLIQSNASNRSFQNRATQTKVTKMLILVSSVFFCLQMPWFIFKQISLYYVNIYTKIKWFILAHRLVTLLYDTSYGINFVLYCMSGQNFRREMIRMFTRRSDTERE